MRIEQFKVERWMSLYELGARFNLAETDAKPFTLEEFLSLGDREVLTGQLMKTKLGYNPTAGSESLREIIARRYEGSRPEEVLVTVGAIEADFLLSNVLSGPGDTVIVQFPTYQVLHSVAGARGARVKFWRLEMEEGFRPNLESLGRLIDDRTRLLVINNPHNPTGSSLSRAELETILEWAEEKGFWVLSDEVYHGITFEDDAVGPLARSMSSRAISVGSMSKTFGLSGLRLGWMVAPPEIVEACWSWKDYTSISNAPLSDFLASIALREIDKVFERNLALARRNLDTLLNWFEEMKEFVTYVPPRAGLVCFPQFHLPVSTEEFCRKAFMEKGVLMIPGECFDMPGHIRFGFGGDPAEFSAGLSEVKDLLKSL